jgi:hypothetical protein
MKKEINNILLQMQNNIIDVGEASNQLLNLFNVRGIFTAEQMKESYMDGFVDGYNDKEDFDIGNYY